VPGGGGQGRLDSVVWNELREIQFPPFTAAIFRATVFQSVGLLDEDFESYLEDVDFGIRCATAGLTGLYVPDAVAYHHGSATLGRWHPEIVRKIARNQLLLVAKHYPPKWILRYCWPIFVAQTLWGLVALRHGTVSAYLVGKLDGLRLFRRTKGKYQASLPAILERSEKEIRELQRLTGFDLYWKTLLRFNMTGVVVVTYNSAEVIERCLDSCRNLPVVVVDNASRDNTRELVARRAHVKLVPNRTNRSFAAAVNQGVAGLDADLILVLNPDVELETPIDALESACRTEGLD